jgi:gas vesicle protein
MNTAIIVAIVALVATVVGAIIGAATTYFLAVRRERADRNTDSRNHGVEVKRAARLIDHELARAQGIATIAIEKRYWVDAAELSTEAWQKYGGTIASDLSNEAWHAVTIAFMAVEHIKGSMALYRGGVLRDRPLSDQNAEGVAPMLRDVTLGREALAPFVWDDPHFRESVGPLVDRAPAVAKAYADMKQHVDYVTAEARRLTDGVREATAQQTDAPAQRFLPESHGLLVATGVFWDHVGKLLFPSQPLSPEITEKTLMAVRGAFVKAYEQVNAEVTRRMDSAQDTTKSIEAEKQNVLKG